MKVIDDDDEFFFSAQHRTDEYFSYAQVQQESLILVGMTLNIDYQKLSAGDKDELKGKLRDTFAKSAGVDQAAVSVELVRRRTSTYEFHRDCSLIHTSTFSEGIPQLALELIFVACTKLLIINVQSHTNQDQGLLLHLGVRKIFVSSMLRGEKKFVIVVNYFHY